MERERDGEREKMNDQNRKEWESKIKVPRRNPGDENMKTHG